MALLFSDKLPFWVSSRTIRSNLLKSYLLAFPNATQVPYANDIAGVSSVAKFLLQGKFEKIVFLESVPNPLGILQLLQKNKALEKKTFRKMVFYFHIYGDFTLFTPEWKMCFEILKKHRVKILAASPAQKGLLSEFISLSQKPDQRQTVEVCPFPIDTTQYFPAADLNEVNRIRKKYNFHPDELLLIYSGRISTQKGFPNSLLWVVKAFQKMKIDNYRMILVGTFDDMGTPLWSNSEDCLGTSFQNFQKALNQLSPENQRKITYVGQRSSVEELRELYQASDIFVSLSVFHDEDYGMAPLEALFCQCSAILTGWGGFNSFKLNGVATGLCSVRIASEGIQINQSEFFEQLKKLIRKHGLTKPNSQQVLLHRNFSIEAVARLLFGMHGEKVETLSAVRPLLTKHSDRILKKRTFGIPVYSETSSKDRTYARLYRHYCYWP